MGNNQISNEQIFVDKLIDEVAKVYCIPKKYLTIDHTTTDQISRADQEKFINYVKRLKNRYFL